MIVARGRSTRLTLRACGHKVHSGVSRFTPNVLGRVAYLMYAKTGSVIMQPSVFHFHRSAPPSALHEFDPHSRCTQNAASLNGFLLGFGCSVVETAWNPA